jgi:hypothetical protein
VAQPAGAWRRTGCGADNERTEVLDPGFLESREAGIPLAVVVARISAQVLVVVLAWVATSKPTGKG